MLNAWHNKCTRVAILELRGELIERQDQKISRICERLAGAEEKVRSLQVRRPH